MWINKMKNNELKYGFRLISEQEIDEISSISRRLIHEQSGAELLHFENTDSNKVFLIGFKTPPDNSRGIPHILEHCVLNGSRKFTCKEPFVELLKGSMQTFTNAMTYPDKTVYPIASTNDQDFFNLMDVYMDAVFFPNIYSNPDIFRQEGWHYELNNSEDNLGIKGVVYNEMEGVFSSPEQILFRSIMKSLLPDTIYANESGGEPDEIPELTYEEFIAFHKRYYHPSNCKIILYGDGKLDKQLAFLNEGFLDQFQRKEMNISSWIQTRIPENKSVDLVYPLSEDESEDGKAYLNLSYVVGNNLNPETVLGMDILEHILLGTPASPLKNRLLKENLGKDIFGQFDSELLQPIFSITAKHTIPEKKEEFGIIINETLTSLAENGIDEQIVRASVNIKEFRLREADFGGYPKGLVFGLSSLAHWIYSDNPLEILEFEKPLKSIKEKIGNRYFEGLIKEYLIENPHRMTISLLPKKGLTEERMLRKTENLKNYKSELSDSELNAIIAETNNLRDRQLAVDSEENLKTIPLLNLSDLNRRPEKIEIISDDIDGNSRLLHTGDTRGIGYVKYFFDAQMISQDDLKWTSLLVSILGKVNTEKYSYEKLSNEILLHTGGIGFSLDTFQIENSEEFLTKLTVSTKALNPKIKDSNRLIHEILSSSKFDDKNRIREIVRELKSRMEMSIAHSGHQVASTRLLSYLNSIGIHHECTGGLEFYWFLFQLDMDFDNSYDMLKDKLNKIVLKLYKKENMVIEQTSEIGSEKLLKDDIKDYLMQLPDSKSSKQIITTTPKILNEGLSIPSRVQYVAQGYNFRKLGFKHSGAMTVFSRIAGLDYLWNTVRVQGGAYGSFVSLARSGDTVFSSYRDPNLKKTLEVFRGTNEYLRQFNPSEREMRKYIIGSISSLDKPLTPKMKGSVGTARYFKKINEDMIKKHREEVMETKPEHIRELTEMIDAVLEKKVICVVGNEGKLQKNKSVFGKILPIFN